MEIVENFTICRPQRGGGPEKSPLARKYYRKNFVFQFINTGKISASYCKKRIMCYNFYSNSLMFL